MVNRKGRIKVIVTAVAPRWSVPVDSRFQRYVRAPAPVGFRLLLPYFPSVSMLSSLTVLCSAPKSSQNYVFERFKKHVLCENVVR